MNSSSTPVSPEAIKQIFTEARTAQGWLSKEVSDQILHEVYEMVKWGPTSANLCPARILFIKSAAEKEKLFSCLSPGNVEKVKKAPLTAVIAQDEKFYDQVGKLFPQATSFREMLVSNKELADTTALRNSSLQGAYFILAARALGLGCGPMSGFDNKKLDEAFFQGTTWKSNFICTLGYADTTKNLPRLARLSFEEACKIV